MKSVRYCVVGAGVSGLAFANFIEDEDVLVLERDAEIGGYCKTVLRDGFVWDYSGHFFHFRHPEIEAYLRARMRDTEILTVARKSRILYGDALIDFPFQKNIHQLPREDFIDCLHDLVMAAGDDGDEATNFEEMLLKRFGRGICDRFLIPYNEKLYATSLDTLDVEAMGRFFPHADLKAIVSNFKDADDSSYNATFTYPRGGAIEYINALASEVPSERLSLSSEVVSIDLDAHTLTLGGGEQVRYEYLVTSAPFDRLLGLVGWELDRSVFTSNKVLVFNLGFDKKGWEDAHWVYFPERKYSFYRVGFYDNIFGDPRMSLYVEIGLSPEDEVDIEASLAQVLNDLRSAGVVTDQELVAHHSVVLDPAYVHVRQSAIDAFARYTRMLEARGVYTMGRYGGWTYCSIEDNIVEARALADLFNTLDA